MTTELDLSHLLQCLDSRRWAQEFTKYLESNPGTVIDEEFMTGWFSSLIMTTISEIKRRDTAKADFITYPELYKRANANNQGLSENWRQYLFWLKSLRPKFFYERIANRYGIKTIKLSHDEPPLIVIVQQEEYSPVEQLSNSETITVIEAEAKLFDHLPPELD